MIEFITRIRPHVVTHKLNLINDSRRPINRRHCTPG